MRPYIAPAIALVLAALLAWLAPPVIPPGHWLSILPPLVAIGVALVSRQVIPSLFAGVWLGAWLVNGADIAAVWSGLLDSGKVYVHGALADGDHAAVILFSMMIGGLVGIISRNGGMAGIVTRISGLASSARRASLTTAGMGLAIFFDDYANSLVVGNTMRPITDRVGVSREKLAYLVDSTAAPVSCIALVTTWIGFEIGQIDAGLDAVGAQGNAYAILLASIPYSFYALFALMFVFMVAATGRDFGPMLVAERASRSRPRAETETTTLDPELQPAPHRPARAMNAVVPIVTLVLVVMGGIYATGYGEGKALREIVGDANSFDALVWGSLVAVIVAAMMSLVQGILDLEETVAAWLAGMRAMLVAMIILVLAWALAGTTDALGTAQFLTAALVDTLPAAALPALVFVLAAATAFATGTSWGTMGILMPLVVPLAWTMTGGDINAVFLTAVGSVLTGAVWGDHCSPISDTTILSSMASGCDHVEHVRTQLPYALVVGAVTVLLGIVPASLGLPWWLALLMGGVALYVTLWIFGRPSREE